MNHSSFISDSENMFQSFSRSSNQYYNQCGYNQEYVLPIQPKTQDVSIHLNTLKKYKLLEFIFFRMLSVRSSNPQLKSLTQSYVDLYLKSQKENDKQQKINQIMEAIQEAKNKITRNIIQSKINNKQLEQGWNQIQTDKIIIQIISKFFNDILLDQNKKEQFNLQQTQIIALKQIIYQIKTIQSNQYASLTAKELNNINHITEIQKQKIQKMNTQINKYRTVRKQSVQDQENDHVLNLKRTKIQDMLSKQLKNKAFNKDILSQHNIKMTPNQYSTTIENLQKNVSKIQSQIYQCKSIKQQKINKQILLQYKLTSLRSKKQQIDKKISEKKQSVIVKQNVEQHINNFVQNSQISHKFNFNQQMSNEQFLLNTYTFDKMAIQKQSQGVRPISEIRHQTVEIDILNPKVKYLGKPIIKVQNQQFNTNCKPFSYIKTSKQLINVILIIWLVVLIINAIKIQLSGDNNENSEIRIQNQPHTVVYTQKRKIKSSSNDSDSGIPQSQRLNKGENTFDRQNVYEETIVVKQVQNVHERKDRDWISIARMEYQ